MREWLRLHSTLCVWLLIPGVLVLPLITWVLYQVAVWLRLLVTIAGNLILFPVAALAAVVCVMIALCLLKAIAGK